MGRCSYSVYGYGFTEDEARRDALQRDREENGHQEGYSGSMCSSTNENDRSKCVKKPKIAKRAKVKKNAQNGSRKWATVHVLSPIGLEDHSDAWRLEKVLRCHTQGQAIAEAKKLAIKHQRNFRIMIEKRLVNCSNEIATIEVPKAEQGQWLFTGTARE